MIKTIASLHSFKGWFFTFALLSIAAIILPILNIFVPEESVFHVPDYMFALFGKYLCYALVALSIDLIWGYTGILSLGHGSFLLYRRICHGHVLDEECWKRRCL